MNSLFPISIDLKYSQNYFHQLLDSKPKWILNQSFPSIPKEEPPVYEVSDVSEEDGEDEMIDLTQKENSSPIEIVEIISNESAPITPEIIEIASESSSHEKNKKRKKSMKKKIIKKMKSLKKKWLKISKMRERIVTIEGTIAEEEINPYQPIRTLPFLKGHEERIRLKDEQDLIARFSPENDKLIPSSSKIQLKGNISIEKIKMKDLCIDEDEKEKIPSTRTVEIFVLDVIDWKIVKKKKEEKEEDDDV